MGRLLWQHATPDEQGRQELESFTDDLTTWWADVASSHTVFLALTDDGNAIGTAWLALVPRPPRPGEVERRSADLQSVFVEQAHRGIGVGAALIRAASHEAARHGARRLTVNSGRKATPLYRRLGFADSPQLLQQEIG